MGAAHVASRLGREPKVVDEGGADALMQEVLSDPESRAAYETAREQLDFLATARRIRERLGLSQGQVAAAMGTTQSAVSDLEAGRVAPRVQTLQRYANALGGQLELRLTKTSGAGLTGVADSSRVLRRITATLLMNLWSDARSMSAITTATTWPAAVLEPILAQLQESGWATSTGSDDQQTYSLNKTAGRIIGLHLRRDRVTAVLQNLSAEVSGARTVELTDGRRETVVGAAAMLVEELQAIESEGELIGVGAVVAGAVDTETGIVLFAPDLQCAEDNWQDVPLRELLTEALEKRGHTFPVAIENDANAVAVREFGRHLGRYIVGIVLSGGGVGVGAVRFNRGVAGIYHGATFRAGEGGHTTVDPSGPPCRTGSPHNGCLETVASAQGILATIGVLAVSDAEIRAGLDVANARLREGDNAVAAAFHQAGVYFGRFLATTQAFLDPNVIVVTAHQQFFDASSKCGVIFQDGITEALNQSALGEGPVMQPELRWTPVDLQTYAIAAGSAAWRYFLAHPDEIAPSILRTVTGVETRSVDTKNVEPATC